MISFLCWNARGLGQSEKRRALKDILTLHKTDIVAIQETKKESFSVRQLNALSNTISYWLHKSSVGASGGILLGINESKFEVLDSWVMDFSISVLLSNKNEPFIWLFTTVYGPVLSVNRTAFFTEINSIYSLGHTAWLIGGDFNLIRARSEKTGASFNYVLSNRFNDVISNLTLIELPLSNRKFTWARSITSPSKALLDRFLCTSDWLDH